MPTATAPARTQVERPSIAALTPLARPPPPQAPTPGAAPETHTTLDSAPQTRFNAYSRITVRYAQGGLNDAWISWLSATFSFRRPRVQRLAEKLMPADFADRLLNDSASLLTLRDEGGETFFSPGSFEELRKWDTLFELETMRLEDSRPRILIKELGGTQPKAFESSV